MNVKWNLIKAVLKKNYDPRAVLNQFKMFKLLSCGCLSYKYIFPILSTSKKNLKIYFEFNSEKGN